MSKKQKNQATDVTNPYDKVFDDAQWKLRKLGDFDYLKEIHRGNEKEVASIPFPYGGRKISSYNYN